VAVKGGSLHRGWKSRSCRVDLRGGAENPKVSQSAFVRKEKIARWETGLDGPDVGGGAHEAVGRPSLELVPERGELPGDVDRGQKGVLAVAEDGKEEAGGEPVAEERGEADPMRGESFDRHEGSLGLGQPFDKVGGSRNRGCEPVTRPPDLSLGFENRPIQVDRGIGDWARIPVRMPMDKFRFGDREAHAQPGPSGLQLGVQPL